MILAKRLLGASQKGVYVPTSYTTDWKFPTAVAVGFAGDSSWFNPTNAFADDANFANSNTPGSLWDPGEITDRLHYSGFGFTIWDVPGGATITGIEYEAEWDRSVSGGEYTRFYNFANGSNSSFGSEVTNFGTTDGATVGPNEITAADIVDPDFYLRFSMLCTSKGSDSLQLYYVKCRIHYDY